MSGNIDGFLKEAGYLNAPVVRWSWRNATPGFRHHLRQLLLLASLCSLPAASLFAILTRLNGRDRLLLFCFYFVAGILLFAVADCLVGLLVRMGFPTRIRAGGWLLNHLPIPIGAALLLLLGGILSDVIAMKAVEVQLLIWAALVPTAWLSGRSMRLLFVSRLYWRGLRPPGYRGYPLLMGGAMLAMCLFLFVQARKVTPRPERVVQAKPAVVLLAFDLPESLFEDYAGIFPAWPRQDLEVPGNDITSFWTSLGTGTEPRHHSASLFTYEAPLFQGRLNQKDPTQVAPLQFLRFFSLVRPLADGGRYRKYFWEILDEYRLRAYAFSFWNSFPAASQNGGVLSERWSLSSSEPPYLSGIVTHPPPENLEMVVPAALQATLDRENQTWAQLYQRAENADFDLCIAYFPLGDLLPHLSEGPSSDQEQLKAFRRRILQGLFQRLPETTRFGIFIASGNNAKGNRIRLSTISNWLPEFSTPFQTHLQIAPTILNYYGLPQDRLMSPACFTQPLNLNVQKADYGEPLRTPFSDPKSDSSYYEELKSLGYIR